MLVRYTDVYCNVSPSGHSREPLLNGKAQYGWPPFTNKSRSASYQLKILFTFLTKLGTLLWRSFVLSLPVKLVFPGRSTLLPICWCNYTGMTLLHNGFTRFSLYLKTEFFVDLKRSSFWPSCDVRSLSNDVLHAIPWQCMLSLSTCILPRNPHQKGSVQMTSSSFYLPFQINYF
jgi:hypothetical protein